MYAIIRTGGKQQKVHEGDVLDVERIKGAETAKFTPLLLVAEDGSVVSDQAALSAASVTVEIVGERRGPKIDGFTYKNKTGNRRRQGHRQTYTTVKVTKIDTGAKKAAKKSTKKAAAPADSSDSPEEAAPAAADAATEEE